MRRPVPKAAASIGAWLTIFQVGIISTSAENEKLQSFFPLICIVGIICLDFQKIWKIPIISCCFRVLQKIGTSVLCKILI